MLLAVAVVDMKKSASRVVSLSYHSSKKYLWTVMPHIFNRIVRNLNRSNTTLGLQLSFTLHLRLVDIFLSLQTRFISGFSSN